jgi:hypothetical protein
VTFAVAAVVVSLIGSLFLGSFAWLGLAAAGGRINSLAILAGVIGLAFSVLLAWGILRGIEALSCRNRRHSVALGTAAGAAFGLVLGGVLRSALLTRDPDNGFPALSYWALYVCSFILALVGASLQRWIRGTALPAQQAEAQSH